MTNEKEPTPQGDFAGAMRVLDEQIQSEERKRADAREEWKIACGRVEVLRELRAALAQAQPKGATR